MIEAMLAGIGLLVGGALGWVLGGRKEGERVRRRIAAFAAEVKAGRVPGADGPGHQEIPVLGELGGALSTGWIPRGQERHEAIRDTLARTALYLRHRVETPLREALKSGGQGLSWGARAALDAVEDLEFYLEEPPADPPLESCNLVDLTQEVTREFAAQSRAMMKISIPSGPVWARVDPDSLRDALFLVLHNAAEFGGGEPVRIAVVEMDGRPRIRVRDSGPGFSAEGMQRAFDPLYSTSPGGLGMGLPYVRKAVEAQGGEIALRNRPGGGAEVEILLLPTS